MKLKIISICIMATTVTHLAFAAPHERGAYVEGNIGANYSSFHLFHTSYSSFHSVGANANLGYQFFQYLAIEAGASSYGDGIFGVDAAVKGILPINKVSLFGKIGASDFFSGHYHTVLPYLGVGGAYSMTPNLDFNVQAQGATMGFFSLRLLSAGLTYHFD